MIIATVPAGRLVRPRAVSPWASHRERQRFREPDQIDLAPAARLFEDMNEVALHGADGNAEQGRDRVSCVSLADELENANLGRRQVIELVERIVKQSRRPGG